MKSSAAPNRAGASAALALYALLTLVLFGRALINGFASLHFGRGVDSAFLMWALVWWPYAIAHALNPFLCKLAWAPNGFNLAWSGGLPLAALAATPLTRWAGPIVSYNILCLIAPIAAAWSAFLLCRHISKSFWPSLVGGYIFGFSPYMLGQLMGGHLNLLFVFPAPLLTLAALSSIKQERAGLGLILAVVTLFVAEFLLSIELAATLLLFGVVTLIVGWILADRAMRATLQGLAFAGLGAGGIAVLVLAPYLYYLFQPGAPHAAINSPGGYSADLANLFIPTPTAQLGIINGVQTLSNRFPANLSERGAYFGIPLLFVIGHFGLKRWATRTARLLIITFSLIMLCALGPRLRFVGLTGFGMPWKFAMHLPMIKNALPVRFTNYAFLAAAVMTTLWLADRGIPRAGRIIVAALIALSILPNLDRRFWLSPTPVPEFFSRRLYQQYLRPDATVVALPFGIAGNSMLWQATAGMYFRMAGGYTGITPREFESWPAFRILTTHTYSADTPAQLLALMATHDADILLVDDTDQKFWSPVLAIIDPVPRNVGGIWLYRATPAALAQYRTTSALAMETRDAGARFDAEIIAARRYLASGHELAALTPMRAQQLGLLPPNWVNDPDVRTGNGLYLGPWPQDRVAIGIVGSYDALRPLITRYQIRAAETYFPFPRMLEGTPTGDNFMRLMVMVFDRKALANTTLTCGPQSPAICATASRSP